MIDVSTVRADLVAEQAALDAVVDGLSVEDWGRSTPCPGWSVADQVAHLAYFDRAAVAAIVDRAGFVDLRDALLAVSEEGDGGADHLTLGPSRSMSNADLLSHWREGRALLAEAAATLENDTRIEWYGPSMGSKSFLTARLMECWAHGCDIVDAVDGDRPPTDRLRHVAQLGVATRGWSYVNRGEDPPEGDVRVRLDAPSGAEWTWGPDDAASSVDGEAVDFCLVVTRRRPVDVTALEVVGDPARGWLERAQAFAGPPTDGPPGSGSRSARS